MFFEMDPLFFDKHVIAPYLSSLLISHSKMKTDWYDLIGKTVTSSCVSKIQMQLIYKIHPELFEQSPEKYPWGINCQYILSEEQVHSFINYQEKVILLDDTPEILISGL